ncbi:MAG: hypothetical protein JWO77_3765 [Ilumatobacteraceae bacterium]|nr:hypothetical protein [Ilumatobacteraceae bacterium]
MDVSEVRDDLLAEQEALDLVVRDLTAEQLALPTPSPRWTVADQLSHLIYFDRAAVIAITEPDEFPAQVHLLLEAAAGGDEAVDAFEMDEWRHLPPAELLAAWRAHRAALAAAAETLRNDTRVAWYGPSMGSKSFLTARLMEVWAHGQDIVDALGADRPATDRLRHIAQLGSITRTWSYLNRGLEPPEGEVAIVLTSPSGEIWTYGDEGTTENTVTGPAEDFCLVTTQRRHVDDTDLVVTGDVARDWLVRAQAFAGPATDGPAPRTAKES